MHRPDYDLKWREDAAVYELEDQLETETIAWFKKFYNGDEGFVKKYSKQKLAEYTSRCHTNGISYDRMLIIAKIYIIVAMFDDVIVDTNPNPYVWDKVTTLLLDIMKNNKTVAIDHNDPENYMYSAWSDIWQEICLHSPKHWQVQVASSFEYWFASMKIENPIRDSKRLLNYTEYRPLRLISIFVEICFDFMEFAQNEYLTMEERANSTFKLLYIHAKTVVYLTNDLYSWQKEKRIGDNMNIMFIYEQQSKLSKEETIAKIVKKINKELDAMYCILDNYRSLMPLGIEFYWTALLRFMRGNYDFHRSCQRYE